ARDATVCCAARTARPAGERLLSRGPMFFPTHAAACPRKTRGVPLPPSSPPVRAARRRRGAPPPEASGRPARSGHRRTRSASGRTLILGLTAGGIAVVTLVAFAGVFRHGSVNCDDWEDVQ